MKVAIIFGTRPEAIKLAPVILVLRNHTKIDCSVCVTAVDGAIREIFGFICRGRSHCRGENKAVVDINPPEIMSFDLSSIILTKINNFYVFINNIFVKSGCK